MRRFRFRMITVQIHPALQWGLALSIIAVLVLWMAQGYHQTNAALAPVASTSAVAQSALERPHFGWADLLRMGIPAVRFVEGPDQPSTFAALSSLFTSAMNIQLTDPRTYLSSQIPMLLTVPRPTTTLSPSPTVVPPPIQIPNGDIDPLSPERPDSQPADTQKASILIYHSHNAEAYQGTSKERYIYNNDNLTVMRVGDELEKELAKLGVNVVHDKTHHMDKSFNDSYLNSRKTVQDDMKKNPDLKMIFDMHNDGNDVLTWDQYLSITTTMINNERVARVLIVLGTNPKLGITPDFSKNEAFAKALHKKMEELYPGLSRGVFYEPLGRYNQDLSPNALLLEIGGNMNSMDEALRTAPYLAKVLAEMNKTR